MGSWEGPIEDLLGERADRARRDHARLRARDVTLWPSPTPDPGPGTATGAGTGAWLGWLDGPERAERHLAPIAAVVAALRSEGITDVVLTGMGGSSLFPMVLRAVLGRAPDHPELHVIDSTDPAAVARVERAVDWTRTVLVVASKSGTTIETRAHLERFRMRIEQALAGSAAGRIVVVTDPGSELDALARAQGFRAVIQGDADVGGRYSALSPFGLLPAAIIGADLDGMLRDVSMAMADWDADPWQDAGPAMLGTLLAWGVETGRDALHLIAPPATGGFGAWIEQLVAESSGKDGTGVLPIVVASPAEVAVGPRSIVVSLGAFEGLEDLVARRVPVLVTPWDGASGLAREAMRWMQAVALACAGIGVDPFDQPDVAAAKAATAAALEAGDALEEPVALASLETALATAGYIALLAFVDPEDAVMAQLVSTVGRLASRFAVPVTLGVGPRYLHSTGQLHKGGRPDGAHLILVRDDPEDVAIPGRPYGFSRLKRSQATGDLAALRGAGRRAWRVDLTDLGLGPDDAASAVRVVERG